MDPELKQNDDGDGNEEGKTSNEKGTNRETDDICAHTELHHDCGECSHQPHDEDEDDGSYTLAVTASWGPVRESSSRIICGSTPRRS